MPDLVIAFTCTPDDRPCVASNRFEMNWNSAIASRLKRGWPPGPSCAGHLLAVEIELELAESRPACGPAPARRPIAVVRLPGASSASDIQLRPCTGSSDICRGSMLPPRLDVGHVEQRRFAGDGHRLLQR